MIAVVIPAFRARATLQTVVRRALDLADLVIVVDDACPERCTDTLATDDVRIVVLHHEMNRGVGAAMKSGFRHALLAGASYIVKVDADDQMDTDHVPQMIDILRDHAEVDLVKGNRFADASTLQTMPAARLIGNAGLTLLIKFSSGYWTVVDPTNGFIAVRAEMLRRLDLDALADRYFFEIDLLCALGLQRRVIAELEMPAIYGSERSSLSIGHTLATFPLKLAARFLRRILVNYFIVEINVGSLCAVIGIPLLIFAAVFGGREWAASLGSGIPRPTGTIVLALLLFMVGFQLTLQALLYDVQFSTRTLKFRRAAVRSVVEVV